MVLKDMFGRLAWFFAGLTLAFSVGITSGYNIGSTVIVTLTLVSFLFQSPQKVLSKEDKDLFFTFLLFALSMFFAVYLDGMSIRDLDKPSRFIFVLPVLLLLLRVNNRKEWLWYGLIFGALFAFPMAFNERFVLGFDRASVGIHPIMFGNTGMLLGLLSFAGATYFFSQKRYFLLSLAILGGLCGVGASVLSGTRGGWVGLPLIGLFMFWQCRDLLGRKALASVFTVATLLVAIAIATPQTGIQQRVNDAVYDIASYIDGSHTETSVGMRFDMWKAAYMMFEQAPIFGVGSSQVIPIKRDLASQGIISEQSAGFGHSHNEYLDALSKRGLVGLLFLLAVYLIPLRLFLNKLKEHSTNWRIRSYAIAGALIPMCYIDFGISQVMFAHNMGVVMYAFPIVFFWAALRWAEREELERASSV